jgi:hypothetical protein
MANSLNRNLKAGEKVVMNDGETVIIASDNTFGAMSFTQGTALGVRRIGSNETLRCSGYDIDSEETMKRHAAENGWQIPEQKL